MKLPTYVPVMALVALMSFSCSTDAIEEETIEAVISSYVPKTKIIEIEIMELINAHRIEKGLSPLGEMNEIKAEAFSHTDYMIDRQQVSHDNFYQRRANLMTSANATRVGENVAYAYSSAQSVVNAWLNSEGHKNVIEGDFTHFDLSAEKDEDGRWYYTNIFIKQ